MKTYGYFDEVGKNRIGVDLETIVHFEEILDEDPDGDTSARLFCEFGDPHLVVIDVEQSFDEVKAILESPRWTGGD